MIEQAKSAVHTSEVRVGLVMVYTGHGKGKTTAALGTVIRAWGRGMRPCVIQFIKSGGGGWGEIRAAERLGIEWYTAGDGCTWKSTDLSASADLARAAWELAQEKICGNAYDLVVLDEFTYPLRFGWVDTEQAVAWLRGHKPPSLHLIVTGRDAPRPLVEYADLVTEMAKIRHPFDHGVVGQPGIEF